MKFGLLGKKLSHSFSPEIHKMLSNDEYLLHECDNQEFNEFLMRRDFCGVNITIPYKKQAMTFCDEISKDALNIGCINTIVNKNGKLIGDNTDAYGFLYLIDKLKLSLKGKKVIILGSGGTSLTAKACCINRGAKEIVVVSRNGDDNYDNISKHFDANVIVNTTPVGMSPNLGVSPINISEFIQLEGVIDVIYNPLLTELLFQAKELSVPCINGLSMLVAQAKRAHELFFDTIVLDTEIDRIIKKIEHEQKNLVLIGMPGVGKTTLGKQLAKALNRVFVDTDEVIKQTTSMKITDIFSNKGEDYFREIEQKVISEVTAKFSQVIATGGGSILKEKNCRAICQNSFVVWIDREDEMLDKKDRPLSHDDKALSKLRSIRQPIYQKTCNEEINLSIDINKDIQKILEAFYEDDSCNSRS